MNRQDELRSVLLDILKTGLMVIRSYGWIGDAAACAVEADHLHNLPSLVKSLHMEQIRFYYEHSRPIFIEVSTNTTTIYEGDWERLRQLLYE